MTRVLDLGGVSGVFVREFAARGRGVTLASDAEAVEAVWPPLSRAGVDLVAGDSANLPVSEAELIFAGNAFAGRDPDDARAFAAGAFDALEPGGAAAFIDSLHGRCSTDATAGRAMNALVAGRGDLHDEETVRSWVESAGFDGCTVRDVPGTDLQAVVGECTIDQDRPPRSTTDNLVLRDDMIDDLGRSLGLLPKAVSIAVHNAPQYEFVTGSSCQSRPTGCRSTDTTALAPTTVARLLTALDSQPGNEIFVVDTGIGYAIAALAEIVGNVRVHAANITCSLTYETHEDLQRVGYDSVFVDCRDGAEGLTDYTSFDRILVEVSAVRPLARLLARLANSGRLVMSKGVGEQMLVAIEDGEVTGSFGPLSFKPLLTGGEQIGSIAGNRTRHEDPEYEGRG